jgi:predicted transcriptional regulator
MASFKQLKQRRMMHGISRPMLARQMDCSESWIRLLELGYQGRNFSDWQERYSHAVTALVEAQKVRQ